MSARLVVDASAAAAVVFREPEAVVVLPLLLAAKRLLVPQIFTLELASVARTKVLRGELDWRAAEELLRSTEDWPLENVEVTWLLAWNLARDRGVTPYDGAYLAVATSTRAPLLTLDRVLRRAAGSSARP